MQQPSNPNGASAAPLTKIEMPTATSGDDQFGGTRSIHQAYVFSVDKQIGEGTYGQVFMGHDRKTNDKVALKKIRMDTEKEGFPITAIREIKILSTLAHPNVVNLREIVRSEIHKNNNFKGSIYMVFDYAEYDLTGLMESQKYNFTEPQVKCILKQLLKGLAYCHSNGVLHRDLKASNILIDSKGTVKLADFGLARPYNQDAEGGLTNRVITLWYRPPELLLGATKYGSEVDIWSVGCIFAELLTGKPLFPGKDDMDQLDKIFQIMGAPTEQAWPGVAALQLKNYKNVPLERYPRQHRLRETLRNKVAGAGVTRPPVSEEAIKLLELMLALDPKKRITAADAIMHTYMWVDPLPCEAGDLPCRGSSHEFTMKKRKNEIGAGAGQVIQPPGVPGQAPYGGAAAGGQHMGGYAQQGPDPKRPRYGSGPAQGQPQGGYPAGPVGHQRPGQPAPYGGAAGGGGGGYGARSTMAGGYAVALPAQQQQQQQQGYGGRIGGMGPPAAMAGQQGAGGYGHGAPSGPPGYQRGGPARGPPGQGQQWQQGGGKR